MKLRSLLARGALLAGASTFFVGTLRYHKWKQLVRQRLESESHCCRSRVLVIVELP